MKQRWLAGPPLGPGGRACVGLLLLGLITAIPEISNGQEIRRAEPAGTPVSDEVRRAIPVRSATPSLESFAADADVEPAPSATPVRRATAVSRPAESPAQTPVPARQADPVPTPRPALPSPTPNLQPAQAPTPVQARAYPAPGGQSGPSDATAPQADAVSVDKAQFEFANSLYTRKVYDLAAPEYEKYLGGSEYNSDRQIALFRLGECYRALGKKEPARNCYDQVVSLYGTGDYIGPAAYRLADMYFQDKDYASALPMFRKASTRLKDPLVVVSSKFYTARCLENLDLKSQARAAYEEVVSVQGKNEFREAARLSLARMYSDLKRRPEAIEHYDALAKETDKPEVRAEALVKGGLLKLDIKKGAQAAADFNAALAIPEVGQWKELAELGLVHTLFEAGKYKEVIQKYGEMESRVSAERRPELLLILAKAQRQLGDHEKARKVYDEIAKAYPNSEYAREAAYERLVSLYNTNDPGIIEAADAYLQTVDDPEKRDQITLLKAEALYKQQQFSAAAPFYLVLDKSTLPESLKAEALFKLAWCYTQTREFDRAVATFTAFVKEYSNNKLVPTAIAQRAMALQQLKRYPDAIADYDYIIRRYPKSKERELALQQKALIQGQQQDNSAMANTFRLLLKEYPKTPAAAQANYWIGWSAFEAKDYKGAIEYLEKARKLDKDQFLERATLRLMLSHYYLEQRDGLAAEVDLYAHGDGQGKVPPELLRWLGVQFSSDKNYGKAEKYLAQLVARKEDTQLDDRLALARCQIEVSKFDEAAKNARSFIDATNEPVPKANGFLALGRAQLGSRDYDAAQQSAEQACGLQPEGRLNAEGRILLGDIEAARGKFADAAIMFARVAVVFDDANITPQALEKAYEAYIKAGSEADAAKTLNTLQSRYPEYPAKFAKPAPEKKTASDGLK